MIKIGAATVVLVVVFALFAVYAPRYFSVSYDLAQPAAAGASSTTKAVIAEAVIPVKDDRVEVTHQPLPLQVKNIYMTSCVAGTPTFRQDLVELMLATEINSVIIDVKDYSGTISFPPESEAWQPAWQNARCGTRDMRQLIEMLHDNGIFVIARITVFQDPFYTKVRPDLAVKKADGVTVWRDNKGLSFIDVAAKDYWDHIIELAVDSYNLGFDELNFDYVRYPSDGPMSDISFPHSQAGQYGADKPANLEAFFAYLHKTLSDPERFNSYHHTNTGRATATPWLSADLFGMTTTNTDDLSIGQSIERAAPYFDFIAPMVYPSHYPNNYLGLGDPNDHPYKIVRHAMQSGVDRMQASTTVVAGFTHTPLIVTNASGTAIATGKFKKPVYPASKLRTWIQDFDYGGDYDAADVRAQIQASYDAGVMGWMIWAPSNRYTKAALKAPGFLEVSSSSVTSNE